MTRESEQGSTINRRNEFQDPRCEQMNIIIETENKIVWTMVTGKQSLITKSQKT